MGPLSSSVLVCPKAVRRISTQPLKLHQVYSPWHGQKLYSPCRCSQPNTSEYMHKAATTMALSNLGSPLTRASKQVTLRVYQQPLSCSDCCCWGALQRHGGRPVCLWRHARSKRSRVYVDVGFLKAYSWNMEGPKLELEIGSF